MSIRWYVLDEYGEATAVTDVHALFGWERRHGSERLIGYDCVAGVDVSTVLLASAMRPTSLPFETKVFGGQHDLKQWRWGSRKAAEDGHRGVVMALTLGLDPKGDL